MRHRRHERHDYLHRVRSDRSRRRHRARTRSVAARRCGDGGGGHDSARMPADVAGHRGGGFAGLQRPQMARRRFRLLAVLRPRSGASGARDVHESELSAIVGGRRTSRTCATGAFPWAGVSGAQTMVPAPRRRRRRTCKHDCAATSPMLNGWPSKCAQRRRGACWRRCRYRPFVCGTSLRDWKEKRWIDTRWPGSKASTVREWRISRRRSSMAAGWCAFPSAR